MLGLAVRLVGFGRGTVEFGAGFYPFHPDEKTLVKAALALEDPFDPPLTVYGMVPLYVLRAGLGAAAVLGGWDLARPESLQREIYLVARGLAAAVGWAVLPVLWLLGRRFFSEAGAVLAVFLVALAPIAVQQAHFYTVDSFFLLSCTAALYAVLLAAESERRRLYWAAGALIGVAAGVRLNGLALIPLLFVAHLWRAEGRSLQALWARLRRGPVWEGAAAALLVLLALQPFLLADPGRLFSDRTHTGFAYAVEIAQGVAPQVWTLGDRHTVPYWHHWANLWPLGVGWPLTLAFAAGIVHSLVRPNWARTVLLLWCGVYFFPVGGLYFKPLRYLLPLLPPLALLSADLVARVWRGRGAWVWPGRAAAVIVVGYSALYGLAFARVYAYEDSRLEAGRWLGENLPPESLVGVERGAFSMRPILADQGRRVQNMDTSLLFKGRGFLSCQVGQSLIHERVAGLDYLVVIPANRADPFRAAADLVPAADSFYRRLFAGELGFERVRRFKREPSLGPLSFAGDSVEPSFVGYDHPAVLVFRRTPAAAEALAAWGRGIADEPHCPDPALRDAVAAYKAGDAAQARGLLDGLLASYPDLELARLLRAGMQGRDPSAPGGEPLQRYYRERAGFVGQDGMTYAALTLMLLGLEAMGLEALSEGVQQRGEPLPKGINNRLAYLAYRNGDVARAIDRWRQSLRADSAQAGIHANLGQVLAKDARDYQAALPHLERAVQLDPSQAGELSGWIEDLKRALGRARTGAAP